MTQLFSRQTQDWFAQRVGSPTAVQAEGWPHIASGEHVLISAPTGTGKTLTAFLWFIDALKQRAARGELRDETVVLYISPLKSLAGDIRENLRRPNEGIEGTVLRTAVRTGDTTPSERAAMIKKPPHILITTPESLFLLLTAPRSRAMLRTVQAVIVDELHALIGSKRGAHLMLSLARLDVLCGRRVQRIGLSATIRPLERAAQYLAYPSACAMVAPAMEKSAEMRVTAPLPDLRLVSGTVWPDVAARVYELCQSARTVIAFVEGRQQAERLAYAVNQLAGEGFARTHHGCVSREQRLEAEQQLRSGQLRLLCATSSMELGIDVGEVDLVVQVGCPLTVSGALQRMGRAGHQPGRCSVMRIFAKTAADAVSCGLTAEAAMAGVIEPANPPQGCLDVLAQHLVAMAVEGGYSVDEALETAHGCWSFRNIEREDVCDCLRMLAGDWEHEQDRPVRARVLYDRIHGRVLGDAYSRMLAYSAGGTIPDRGWYAAVLADGTHLGELDEEFVFEARVGDKFLLGAFAWRIVEIGKDRVTVAPASPDGARPPFWKGDGQGRAYVVAQRFGQKLLELEQAQRRGRLEAALSALHMDGDAVQNAARHLRRQIEMTGCLPNHRRILCEHFADEAGDHQLMVHAAFGRRVNSALALLCQQLASRLTGQDVHAFEDDDGFLLYLVGSQSLPEGLLQSIDPETAAQRVRALLPATPLFSMTFRYAAACALMMGVRSGRRQPLWVQRIRGAEQFSALAENAEHPLMREALRTCENDLLDLHALEEVLRGVRTGEIEVREMHVNQPSPMALPMRRAVETALMYEYDNIPSRAVRAAQKAIEEQDAAEGIAPSEEALDRQFRREHLPESPEALHSLLMAEGDLAAGELDVPVEWLTHLAAQGRVLYIEPGLWIASELASLYERARAGEEEALQRILRLCLRYRGGQDSAGLAERYAVSEARVRQALDALVHQGKVVESEEIFYHRDVYEQARRDTLRARREQVATAPAERFAALLADGLRIPGEPLNQLRAALSSLLSQSFSLKTWESLLLPARVDGYKPRMLDELLAAGEFSWTLCGDQLSFARTQDIDWEAEPQAPEEALSEDERLVLDALRRRGASFASALAGLLHGRPVLPPLLSLACKGLVRADSLAPLRIGAQALGDARMGVKRLARARANAQSAGRWELARPERALSNEEALERAFDACPLLCRETITGLSWAQAVELLRVWEYTGRARRGYFVAGLGGMQFVRAQDYDRVRHALSQPSGPVRWLMAGDPAQPYGKMLPHAPGRDFLRVPGTAVCLMQGRAVAVLERQGEVLRLFEPENAVQALAALVRDHASGRILAAQDALTIKKYPSEAIGPLEAAGFARVMLDYVRYR